MSMPRLWGGGDAVIGPVMVTPVTVPLASVVLLALFTLSLAGALRPPWGQLPCYQIEIQEDGHAQPGHRSSANRAEVALRLTSLLTLTLRPEQQVQGELALRVFLLEQGQVRPYPLHLHAAGTGTLRLRLPITALPDLATPGEHALLFVLGRPSAALSRYVPTTPPPAGVQVLRGTLYILPGA